MKHRPLALALTLILATAGAASAQVGSTSGGGTDPATRAGNYGVNGGTATKSGAPQPPAPASGTPRATSPTTGAAHADHGSAKGTQR